MSDQTILDYEIPKGTLIQVYTKQLHYDKEVYGDPETFRPERWSPEEQSKRKTPFYSYIPFSAGPRTCIGNNYSLWEQRACISVILQNYRIQNLDNEIKEDSSSIGFSEPQNMKLKFEKI
jgi:cytochrome P450